MVSFLNFFFFLFVVPLPQIVLNYKNANMNVRNVFCKVLFAVLGMLALTVGQTAKADELTLYDGTTTTQYVPMFVYCFDDFTRSQFIIPADSLAEHQ